MTIGVFSEHNRRRIATPGFESQSAHFVLRFTFSDRFYRDMGDAYQCDACGELNARTPRAKYVFEMLNPRGEPKKGVEFELCRSCRNVFEKKHHEAIETIENEKDTARSA